jgi:hypothetical protein
MTVIQDRHPAVSGSRVRRALGRSAHALRNLHDEQVYAWDCFFRAGLPKQPRAQVPPPRPVPDR